MNSVTTPRKDWILCVVLNESCSEKSTVIVNSEELISTTEYLML